MEKPLLPGEAIREGNILQIHSMTKQYAIPGLRLGYITAPAPIITHLRQQQRPWAVNALAIEAGKWLIENCATIIPDLRAYLEETQRLRHELNKIEGVKARQTMTNFFLATIETATAAELKEYLARQHGILIRDASNFKGLNEYYFRIATQLSEENDALVSAVKLFVDLKRGR